MAKRFLRSMGLLVALAGPAALAQNSDLGLLAGITLPTNEVSTDRIRSAVGASGQVNYAYQIFGSRAGEIFLEFPVVIHAGSSAEVTRLGVLAAQGATILFTPGVRFKLPLHSRLSLYAALGGGIGAFGGNQVAVSRLGADAGNRQVSPALDFGGGVDIRLTRLLSVRGEVRDFVSLSGLGGTSGRHHVIGQGGIAFHF